jgi:hypothetical protein
MPPRTIRFAFFVFAFALLAFAKPASALDEIYSPNAEPGEMALEYNGDRTFDKDPGKDDSEGHSFSLEYGLTDRITVETGAGFAQEPADALKLEKIEVETRAQFFEQGENWVDSGLLVAYGFGIQPHAPDNVEVKLLLQKDTGGFTYMANIGFEAGVGQDAGGGPEYSFLWNSRYRLNEMFQPGIELQSGLGQDEELRHFDQQEHYIGPAAYGKLFGNVRYQAAWLFGASDAAAESAARIMLEYEMHI